jgi:hypothetical protein
MNEKKYTLGSIGPLKVYPNEPQGSWIELNIGNHMGAGMLVWRMYGEGRSPKQEAVVREMLEILNSHDELLASANAVLAMENGPYIGPSDQEPFKRLRAAVSAAGAK